jgi:hypothetical protein
MSFRTLGRPIIGVIIDFPHEGRTDTPDEAIVCLAEYLSIGCSRKPHEGWELGLGGRESAILVRRVPGPAGLRVTGPGVTAVLRHLDDLAAWVSAEVKDRGMR